MASKRTPGTRESKRKQDASEKKRQQLKRVLKAFEIAQRMKMKQENFKDQRKDDSAKEGRQKEQGVSELADFLLITQQEILDKLIRRAEEKQARAQKAASERKKGSTKASKSNKVRSIVSEFTARIQKRERDVQHEKSGKQETHSKADTRSPKEKATKEGKSDTRSRERGEQAKKRERARNPEGAKRKGIGETTPHKITRIDAKEKFDRVQDNYPHLKMTKDYEKRYKAISEYFERKKNNENVTKPSLLNRVEKLELRRAYELVNGKRPDIPIDSMSAVDKLLEKDSERRKHPKFADDYRKCKVYFDVRNNWSKMEKELAAEHDVSESAIGNYRRGKEPLLISQLRRSEENRIIQEWAKTQCLDEKTIKDLKVIEQTKIEQALENRMKDIPPARWTKTKSTEHLREAENTSVDDAVKTIEKMVVTDSEAPSKITAADLHGLGISSKRISEIEHVLQSHDKEIHERLKNRFEIFDDIRVGVVNGKLYVWTPDLNKDDMINAWKNVYFYFSAHELSRMIEAVGTELKLGDTHYERIQNLNDLLKQMTRSSSNSFKIEGHRTRIIGESLHFNRDALGLQTKDLEGIITKVAGANGVGGIPNPKFLEGKELEIERARLYAIIKSDGWVSRYRGVGYTESNSNRFGIVEKGLQAWGDIKLTRYNANNERAHETRFPSPFWDALHSWGFPLGDKMMHNEGLGLNVERLSLEAIKTYLGELTPEDGNFCSHSGFSWSRSVVLNPGTKGNEYGFKSLLTPELASLVKEHGTHDKEKQRKVLRVSRLEELTKDSDPLISSEAKELERIVRANPSRLIEDEAKMVQRLGIETHLDPRVIRFSLRTGRVSVYWNATTTNNIDAEKWAIACPPNDVGKRRKVKSWLNKRGSTLADTKQELREKGIPFDEWWI